LTSTYDEQLLHEWKQQQEQRIRDAMDVPRLDSREELNARIRALLRENHEWWLRYGPESEEAARNPFSEAANTWLSCARRVLVPNNWHIVRLLQRNEGYLTPEELAVVEEFRLHAQVFADRHIAGERDPAAPQFPPKMNEIFGD
jgi:hypothetical protein